MTKKVFFTFYELLRDSVSAWITHKGAKMGAALAYYTAFSLAPLIILILSLISLFMKRDEAVRGLVEEMSSLVGADGGTVVRQILAHAGTVTSLSWSTLLSFMILWISASGAFGELQDSLNTIWEVPKQKHPWVTLVKSRLLSLSMVFVLGFFMISSLLISTAITGLSTAWFGSASKFRFEMINTTVSMLVISFLFAALFRMLPDVKITWNDVLPGAFFSAALFLIGKFLLGWYIAHSAFSSNYGAAASFVVILFWVFYSAQILYLGAEFTRAYTLRFGSLGQAADQPRPPTPASA